MKNNFYTLSACEKLISKYLEIGGETKIIQEGILGLGTVVCFANGKKTAIIKCFAETDEEVFNTIQPSELLEMIETAKTYGIENVELHTNFSVDIHSHTLKTSKRYANFKIVKTNP